LNVLWLLLGTALGGLNAWTQRWTVARLRPSAPRCALTWALGGAVLRWGLVAGLLGAALQRELGAALLVCGGLALARWSSIYWWGRVRAPFDRI
jgi:hypothetical protein